MNWSSGTSASRVPSSAPKQRRNECGSSSKVCTGSEGRYVDRDDRLQTVADHKIQVKKSIFFGLAEIPKLIEQAHSGLLVGKGMVVVDEQEQQGVRERQNL